jgi:hypothetical protein
MDHDRSLWFASGVVVGLLIGAGIVGGIAWTKLVEARAETAKEREKNDEYNEYKEAVEKALDRERWVKKMMKRR